MRVLFFSVPFYPRIGGLEGMARILARGLSQAGLDVTIITLTKLGSEPELDEGYRIIRCPSWRQFAREVKRCDRFVHHNVSLKGIWPLLFWRRPWFVIHHLAYDPGSIFFKLTRFLKRMIAKRAYGIYVSRFVQSTISGEGVVIHSCYDSTIFRPVPGIPRDRDVLFVGRLEPVKGCDLLLRSVAKIRGEGRRLNLTFAGGGPERRHLEQAARLLEMADACQFTGPISGEALAHLYHQHKIVAIPSLCFEAFGLVALEGLACGCKVICSDSDGLSEAVGEFGTFFEKGNINDLAAKIIGFLDQPRRSPAEACPDRLERYLAEHRPQTVISYYIDALSHAANQPD